MADVHALRALIEARDVLVASTPDELLKAILEIEQAHAFSDDQDVPLRELDRIIDTYIRLQGSGT
jgi:hypothetical protein